MTCAWQELLAVLPVWMRKEVDTHQELLLQELRLRINAPPELVYSGGSYWLRPRISAEDINYIINAATRYSPWATASMSRGYITISGGHRIGLCGDTVVQQGTVTGIRSVSSLCIRIARDLPGIAENIKNLAGSALLLGPPGSGKTTLLRDLIRERGQSETICVVDDRKELFPEGLSGGKRIDILSGCSKRDGIRMLLRTMNPDCIAMDEITDPDDTDALLEAANCGVQLLATAHASSIEDYQQRRIYQPLLKNHIFSWILVLKKDKSYTIERMSQ